MTEQIVDDIRAFLERSRAPVLVEPGEQPFALMPDSFAIEHIGARVVVQVWDDSRTLARRVVAATLRRPGRMELEVERFGKRTGQVLLIDESRPAPETAGRRATRLELREQFRAALTRQFPGWRLSDLTTEMDLEHTLSPVYPRGMVSRGGAAWAAAASPDDLAAVDGLLTAGLVWLDYLRARERRVTVEGLALFLPAGKESNTCLRLRWMSPHAAHFAVFALDRDGMEERLDPARHGNLDTRVEPAPAAPWTGQAATPEAVLERRIRACTDAIDPSLRREPVYAQAPMVAGIDRGIADLLAVDEAGRLAVMELKAAADPRLPVQALDYWMRVRWHQRAGDFARNGYFPGVRLSEEAPRLLLVAPALEFHSTTESILRYFSPVVPVERIGLAPGAPDEVPRVVFRMRGARGPG